jgi:hypothetical protein
VIGYIFILKKDLMLRRQGRGMISGFWGANKGTWKTLDMEQCNCVMHANEIEEGS